MLKEINKNNKCEGNHSILWRNITIATNLTIILVDEQLYPIKNSQKI